jgi:hypothetical protein
LFAKSIISALFILFTIRVRDISGITISGNGKGIAEAMASIW